MDVSQNLRTVALLLGHGRQGVDGGELPLMKQSAGYGRGYAVDVSVNERESSWPQRCCRLWLRGHIKDRPALFVTSVICIAEFRSSADILFGWMFPLRELTLS